jgi:RNA polymerase sigma-70 factor, ECF subfamily
LILAARDSNSRASRARAGGKMIRTDGASEGRSVTRAAGSRITARMPRAQIGFRSRSAPDRSDEAVRQTRLAVARAKEGDREAFQFLYVTYSGNVYGYVRSIIRDDHEAEDVTQQVFAKLMTSIIKYDERGAPFFAWLVRFARNVAIDHLRVNRATPCENVLDPELPGGNDLEYSLTVREALAGLPEDQRDVVVLRHLVGLSPGEIAHHMGRTESSINGLHHRGRRALQQELVRQHSQPSTAAPKRLAAA